MGYAAITLAIMGFVVGLDFGLRYCYLSWCFCLLVQGFLQFCRDGTFSPHFLRSQQLKQSSRRVIFREFFYGGSWVAGGIGVRFSDKQLQSYCFWQF